VSQGIPKQSAVNDEAEIKADKFVLVVHGTAEEAERAHSILAATSPVANTVPFGHGLERQPAVLRARKRRANQLMAYRHGKLD
jgi:hypothetical protein